MILLVHMILGALIGQNINNPIIAVAIALLSHYLLDIIPHIEYSIKNISQKNWAKSFLEFTKVFFDVLTGLLVIFLVSNRQPMVYVGAICAIIPDGFSFLNLFLKNKIFELHSNIHQEKIHFLKNKKISVFWRLFSQATVVVAVVVLFLR